MQAGRRVVGGEERNLIALTDLADGDSHSALVGADDSADLLLGDEAFGFRAPLLRISLVIGKHQADLGAAKTGQSFVARQRKIEIVLVVDEVCGGFERPLRIDADLRARP